MLLKNENEIAILYSGRSISPRIGDMLMIVVDVATHISKVHGVADETKKSMCDFLYSWIPKYTTEKFFLIFSLNGFVMSWVLPVPEISQRKHQYN